jgi:hypothetical protein
MSLYGCCLIWVKYGVYDRDERNAMVHSPSMVISIGEDLTFLMSTN